MRHGRALHVMATGAIGFNEIPGGVIDGVNDTFTVSAQPVPDVIQLFHGVGAAGVGDLMVVGIHFDIIGPQTFKYKPAYVPAAGDWHRVWYRFGP